MEMTENSVGMILCQKAKDAVNRQKKDYVEFVVKSLNSDSVANASEALLPFDNFVCARQHYVDRASLIESMGFFLMRMGLEPATFSLGISFEIKEGSCNKRAKSMVFITACKTYDKLKQFVESDDFSKQMSETFEQQIDKCFFQK